MSLYSSISRKLRKLFFAPGDIYLVKWIKYKFSLTQAYKLIQFYSKPNRVRTNGFAMYLDRHDMVISPILLRDKIWEPFETEVFMREVKYGDVVLDIGANMGYYTLLASKIIGNNAKIYAFEPDPGNFSLLKKNMKANNIKNVVLEQKAVSNETGKIKLYSCSDNKGDHRIYDSHDGRRALDIRAVSMDDYFKDYKGVINFIKMDIQGAEIGALQGMQALLAKNKPLKMITEYWPNGLRRFGADHEGYLKMILACGFEMFEISEENKTLESTTIPRLLETYTVGKDNFTNLLCIRKA